MEPNSRLPEQSAAFRNEPTIALLNPLTPNDPYSGRTAPLTSKLAFYIFIQQI